MYWGGNQIFLVSPQYIGGTKGGNNAIKITVKHFSNNLLEERDWTQAQLAERLGYTTKHISHFWFNFFHEAAHILLHDKENIFLDEWNSGESLKSEQESEADKWSREFLIPPEYEGELAKLKSKTDVIDFAERIGIHPAIVVGRLQHDHLIDPSWMNDLKVRKSIFNR
jgi:transcriptional regulator with XRE-family HTH domain